MRTVGRIRNSGPVPRLRCPKCSFKPLSVQRRPGFSSRVLSISVVDCIKAIDVFEGGPLSLSAGVPCQAQPVLTRPNIADVASPLLVGRSAVKSRSSRLGAILNLWSVSPSCLMNRAVPVRSWNSCLARVGQLVSAIGAASWRISSVSVPY